MLHGGRVWTGASSKDASAVAIRGARVVAVGSDADVRRLAAGGTKEVDLRGAFVAPGFTDQHTHILEQGDIGSLEPSWTGYNPASAEAVRQALYGYHAATFASQMTPEDTCTSSAVTDEMKEKLLGVQESLASQGLTTVVEAGLSDLGFLEALRQLDAEKKLRVRFLIRVGWGCIDEAVAAGWRQGSGSEWLRVIGVKLYSDGWLGPRSAALLEPYDDRPGSRGFLFLDAERALADVKRARELGFNITTHAIGDAGLTTVLGAYEAAGVTAADRYSIEHAQVLDDALIGRMARVGAIGSIQLSFATTDQRFAESALGPERAGRAYAWRTLLARGVRLAGGSDYPVEQLNPLWGIQRIVTRQEFDGTPPGGWHPGQRLNVDEALSLLTADGAFARREDDRGQLAPGRFADLVVLREDPRALPADCVAAATVLMTIVNGRVAFEGEQAYPPGDAACKSGAAPRKGEKLRVVAASPSSPSPAAAAPSSDRERAQTTRARRVRTVRCRRACGPVRSLRVTRREIAYRLRSRARITLTAGRRRLAVGTRRAKAHRLRHRARPGTRVRLVVEGERTRWVIERRVPRS